MKGSESDTPVAEVSALAISTYSSLFSAAPRGWDLGPPVPPGPGQWMRSVLAAGHQKLAPFWLCVMYPVSALTPLRAHLWVKFTGTPWGHV